MNGFVIIYESNSDYDVGILDDKVYFEKEFAKIIIEKEIEHDSKVGWDYSYSIHSVSIGE